MKFVRSKMVGCIAQHPVYTNYGAKEDGTILNLRTMKNIKPRMNCRGYLLVDVYLNKKRKTYQHHRFVYECFKGDIPPELQVDHIDNDKKNNCIDNLQLLTSAANCQKAPAGKRDPRRPPISVVSICLASGERQTFPSMNAAARELGVYVGQISKIVRKEIGQVSTQSKTNGLWYSFEKLE